MAVTIAEDIQDHLDENELDKCRQFERNPGYGGQRVYVEANHSKFEVNHVTYGTSPFTVTVFYERDGGEDYKIVGVGKHVKEKKGKTVYSALWAGRGYHRHEISVLGKKKK